MEGTVSQWNPLDDEMGDASVIGQGFRIWHAQRVTTPFDKEEMLYSHVQPHPIRDQGMAEAVREVERLMTARRA